MRFNQGDLVLEVKKRLSITEKEAHKPVKGVLLGVQDCLQKEGLFRLPNFGTFWVKDIPAKQSRNPRTGESFETKPSKKIKFRLGEGLRKLLEKELG